jgi:hypothetical protein
MRQLMTKTAVVAALYLVFSAGCASQLKPYKKVNTPKGQGVEQELDLSAIYFNDIHSNARFNILDYMNQNGKEHLLLMFGSKGCSACNLKNEEFKKNVIGQHSLFLDQAGKTFDLIGVNTDTESPERMLAYLTNFDFIRWSDPKGLAMIANFIPPGRTFGVPVTILLNKKGVMFRLLNDEKATPEQIMARVEQAINGSVPSDDSEDDTGDNGSEGGTVTPIPVVPATDLAFVGPGRFKKVDLKTCSNVSENLDTVLGTSDFRIVHVAKDSCGAGCAANVSQLKAVASSICGEEGALAGTKKCSVAALQTGGAALDAASCSTGFAYGGGEKFFEVFESHFNWNYPVFEDPTDYEPRFGKTFDGPLTMVFRRDGTLVWSAEGQLAPNALSSAVKTSGFGLEAAKGPDFPVYTKDKVIKNFSEIRRNAKLTVVVSTLIFDTIGCGSCEIELAHWSKPGGFLDFCAARPNDCQIMLFDFRDVKGLVPMSQFYDLIKNGGTDPEFNVPIKGLSERGIRVPLFLDPLPHSNPDGSVNFSRYYEGYLKAASRELGPVGRIAIYNKEGRILSIHASGQDIEPTDDIFNFVKNSLDSN